MKVRAIARGFYDDTQREIGDVFDLHDITINRPVERKINEFVKVTVKAEEQFSKNWMEVV